MSDVVEITDAQRRARLVTRHHLARTAADVDSAVRDVVALHSSDPATPYLAARARVPDFRVADLDRALFEDRTLWRLHAMRRTLFVVPAADGAAFEAGASRDVAARERRRLEGWLAAEMERADVPAFLAHLSTRVLDVLADGAELRTGDLTALVPELGMEITVGSGKWTTRSPLSSRLLFLMAMDCRIVRTRPAGSWRSSQYHWAAAEPWFGNALRRPRGSAPGSGSGSGPGSALGSMDAEAGRVELARRYLGAFGPVTEADLRWWTGWTAGAARSAMAALGVVTVRLAGGGEGMVLPDDAGTAPVPPPHTAFLPALDPTPMGWKERGWFLGGHHDRLFDRNGNIGPSVWVDGRVVGGWAQRPDGDVVYRLLEDIGTEGRDLVAGEAASLSAWLEGVVVRPRFRTPLERELEGEPA